MKEVKRKIIAIIGLMGVGKTTVGLNLAKALQCYFIDSDSEIEFDDSEIEDPMRSY